jgi:predicted PhzF superfamily epimerase YddE/YHI9
MDATLHVLKVFVGEDDRSGNPLGVFLSGFGLLGGVRQAIAADLGFSETVFVENHAEGLLRIHTPTVELPLAGHPLVGTSWLMAHEGIQVDTLRPPAGEVPTWQAEGLTWIRAQPEWAPDFELRQLADPAAVDAHPGAGPDELLNVWAWEDEEAGLVRSRVFATSVGVVEDEATGSAAMRLGALLRRPLRIRQGIGSFLAARPGPEGTVDVGGLTEIVEIRDYPLP